MASVVAAITGNNFDADTDVPDQWDKVYVVTGGSAGIGFGIVAHILQKLPKRIHVISSNPEHQEEALKELREFGGPDEKVTFHQCNLESMADVGKTVAKIKQEEPVIDGIIANAGLGVGSHRMTEDGLEAHFQVNILSQFYLILSLLPNVQAAAEKKGDARIVIMSSDFHRGAPSDVTFKTVEEMNKDVGPAYLYNRFKLAEVCICRALVRRLEANKLGFNASNKNVFVNATHPGGVATNQQDQAVDAYGTAAKVAVKLLRPALKDPVTHGCRSALFAATSLDVKKENIQGGYIVPDRKVTEPSKQARDDQLGESLWTLCESVLSDKLGRKIVFA